MQEGKKIMTIHEVKITRRYYKDVSSGKKTFEIRKDDRHYETGDLLALQKYDYNKDKYTGNIIVCEITYIHCGYGMQEGYVVLGIDPYFELSKEDVAS